MTNPDWRYWNQSSQVPAEKTLRIYPNSSEKYNGDELRKKKNPLNSLHFLRCGGNSMVLQAMNNGLESNEMAEQSTKNTIHINRYSSRRLYNTTTSDYVTLEDIAKLIRDGNDIKVTDKKTGEDLTRQVLLQIITDHESKGDNVLPLAVLTDLVRSYNETSQNFVPDFLAESFALLKKQQAEIMGSLSGVPNPFDPSAAIEGMDNWRKSQTEMLETMIKPWLPGAGGPAPEAADQSSQSEKKSDVDKDDVESELKLMKKQIEMLQSKLKNIQ